MHKRSGFAMRNMLLVASSPDPPVSRSNSSSSLESQGVFGGPSKKRPSGYKEQKDMLERVQQRRKLQTFSLSPPDYLINPQVLLENYVENDIRFAGIIPNVPVHLDSTSRTDILKVIDRGKKDGTIPWRTSYEHDAIFSLSVNNIKISKRDGVEELLLRVPIHHIATICYIQDDNSFILVLKFGNPEESRDMCKLAVCFCDSRSSSEELCSLVGQCFQLVYTDATMQFFDKKVSEGAKGGVSGTSSVTYSSDYSTSTPKLQDPNHPSFLSRSNLHLDKAAASTVSQTRNRRKRASTTQSESELSQSAALLLEDYIKKMQRVLTNEELKEFAILCKKWHQDMPFKEFCHSVLQLYGQDKKYLLAGMRDFIPEKDYDYFEQFLEQAGVSRNGSNGDGNAASSRHYRRSPSDTSAFSNPVSSDNDSTLIGDDFDRRMNLITSNIATLDASVDINPNRFMSNT